MERVEEASTELLYIADRWQCGQSWSLYDLKNERRRLLDAARTYARAMDALARVR
jgi:hypothetical protein